MSTRSFLSCCGISVVITCPFCRLNEEVMKHLILCYLFSKQVWFQIDSELNLQFSWVQRKDWLSIISQREDGAPMLQRFIQSLVIYTSWEIWKDRSRMVSENDVFLPDKVTLVAIIAVNSISSSIAVLWQSWGFSGLLSEKHQSQQARWDFPPKWQLKINFDDSVLDGNLFCCQK